MSRSDEHITIGFTIWPTGWRALGWRVPGTWADPFSVASLRESALTAERGLLDFYFIGDKISSDTGGQYHSPNVVSRPEPFTAAAYLAGLTRHIGLVITCNTTYSEPYVIARQTAQLDHVSGGRAAWNIVTGLNELPAGNFGRDAHWDNARRYDWAEEFVTIVSRLWDSWEDDAVVAVRETGLLVDPDKVHEINFSGRYFSVRGPLNVGRPPQGQVVIFHAGSSERSREFGARYADVRFIGTISSEYYRDIKGRLPGYGRTPASHPLVAGATFLVAETEREARRRQALLDELTDDLPLDIRVLVRDLKIKDAGYTLRTPVAEIPELSQADGAGSADSEEAVRAWAHAAAAEQAAGVLVHAARSALGEEDIDLGQLYRYVLRRGARGKNYIVGDARQAADWIEDQYDSCALDGVMVFPPYLPGPLTDFVDLVVPELQRRGRFRKQYEPGTLRERWGLEQPANQFRP